MASASWLGKTAKRLLIAGLLGCVVVQASVAAEIEPPDVYQSTMVIRGELERIREALDEPPDTRAEIFVRNAQPREVFFQAVTLWVKADRLCKETRRADLPAVSKVDIASPRDVTPRDVWVMTRNTLGRISCIKRELKLKGDVAAPPRDPAKTPTDVFRSIVQANRQINLLLDYPLTPSDVFAIVELANEFVAETLDAFAPEWRADEPALPAYSDGKQPVDVFRQLLRCFSIIERIAAHSGLKMLELKPAVDQSIVPGDVFDLASLVFSEVRFFATQVGVRKRYTLRVHAEKVPSDVYQQAQRLEAFLDLFENMARSNRRWRTTD